MEEIMRGLLIQVACYAGLMTLTIMGMSMLLRGFFWKYLKVRTSFGKNILVKIRTPLRDYYSVGWVEEGFLCYKHKDFTIRMALNTNDKFLYRSLGITMVDVDEEKNAICKTDYSTVTGFDAKKHSDLLTRALMRPSVTSNKEKIIILVVCVGVIVGAISAFFAFQAYDTANQLTISMPKHVTKAVDAAIERMTGGISGASGVEGVTGTNVTAPTDLT